MTKVSKRPAAPRSNVFLSKKKRRHLQQVVSRSDRKQHRHELIDKLAEVNSRLISQSCPPFVSLQSVQSAGHKGLKRGSSTTVATDIAGCAEVKRGTARVKRRCRGRVHQDADRIASDVTNKLGQGSVVGFSSDEESTDSNDENCGDLTDVVEPVSITRDPPISPSSRSANSHSLHPETEAKLSVEGSQAENPGSNDNNSQASCPFSLSVMTVARTEDLSQTRSQLPIVAEEHTIMDAIKKSPVTLIVGETGCGKTTQVPQFLYEAGFNYSNADADCATNFMIGVTEPRRVAATSVSARVKSELNLKGKSAVGYQISMDSTCDTKSTMIKFMTEGILLQELASDFLLSTYSVIVMDEVHERSIFTDVLVGSLTRAVWLRNQPHHMACLPPLKLVMMSATFAVDDFINSPGLFSRLSFPPKFKSRPPVVHVPGRQFLTTNHFKKTTPANFMDETFATVVKIHQSLPDGGILVFLTGAQEVRDMVSRLSNLFGNQVGSGRRQGWTEAKHCFDKDNDDEELDNVNSFSIEESVGLGMSPVPGARPMRVLPLYAMLPQAQQDCIFDPPSSKSSHLSAHPPRTCVVATNVAETSVTIPGIKYVVDCGKEKVKVYNNQTGVSTYTTQWISKASARQRSGRAGRTQPGHCYRMYSSQVMEDQFAEHATAEIMRRPVDDLVLFLKSIGIDRVANFPLPLPRPDPAQLAAAERRLYILGALDLAKQSSSSSAEFQISQLGRSMASLHIAPAYAKLLVLAASKAEYKASFVLPLCIALVAGLSVAQLWHSSSGLHDGNGNSLSRSVRRRWARPLGASTEKSSNSVSQLGDLLSTIRAVCAASAHLQTERKDGAKFSSAHALVAHRLAELKSDSSQAELAKFCAQYGLNSKSMGEALAAKWHLTMQVGRALTPNADTNISVYTLDELVVLADDVTQLSPPTGLTCRLISQLVTSAGVNRIARRLPGRDGAIYQVMDASDGGKVEQVEVRLERDSVMAEHQLPDWIVYQEAYTLSNTTSTDKIRVAGISCVDCPWLPRLAARKCDIRPLGDTESTVTADGELSIACHVTFGHQSSLSEIWTVADQMKLPFTKLVARPLWTQDQSRVLALHFAWNFLTGGIFQKLQKFRHCLLCEVSSVSALAASVELPNSDANLAAFVSQIEADCTFSRSAFLDAHKADNRYLVAEYQALVVKSAWADIDVVWNRMCR